MPKARATSEATAPGSIAAATIRSLSARDQRRRRCTDVITSTCVFVIGVALGLLLGLAATAHSRKAALTGWVQNRRAPASSCVGGAAGALVLCTRGPTVGYI